MEQWLSLCPQPTPDAPMGELVTMNIRKLGKSQRGGAGAVLEDAIHCCSCIVVFNLLFKLCGVQFIRLLYNTLTFDKLNLVFSTKQHQDLE